MTHALLWLSTTGIELLGGFPFPVQIVVSNRLPPEESTWLRSLNASLESADIKRLIRKGEAVRHVYNMNAYFETIQSANADTIRKGDDAEMEQMVAKLAEEWGFADKWIKEGEQRGMKMGEQRGEKRGESKVLQLVREGKTAEEIERILNAGKS